MKKIRFILAIGALLFAFAAAFASRQALQTQVYQYLDGECISQTASFDCDISGSTIPCTAVATGSEQLRRDNDPENSCGPMLVKSTP